MWCGVTGIADLLERHAERLGSVLVHADPERRFPEAHGVRGGSTIVGLRGDGRLGFALRGTPELTRVIEQLGALR